MIANLRLYLRLLALSFRSKLRRINPAHKAAAEDELARARDFAQQIMERERAVFNAEGLGELFDDTTMLSIELQFLWGAFHELVQEYPILTTNGFDRIKAHLILRLMNVHGYSFEAARDEVTAVEDLYNKSDELFGKVAEFGTKTFHDGCEGRLLTVMKALNGVVNKLDWSEHPGAHEAHLIRRSNNMYFPTSRRIVSREELLEARDKDNEDYILAANRFEEVGNEIEALSSAVPVADWHELRERLDDVIFFSMGVGGPAKQVALDADRVRDALITDLRSAFHDDKDVLDIIEKAEAFHIEKTRRFYIPVLAQMLRENSPIIEEETIATILSENPHTISAIFSIFPEDTQSRLRVLAIKKIQGVFHEGYLDPQFEGKLSALERE